MSYLISIYSRWGILIDVQLDADADADAVVVGTESRALEVEENLRDIEKADAFLNNRGRQLSNFILVIKPLVNKPLWTDFKSSFLNFT